MIFVFGSNLAGRHGKGAAQYALKHKGAVYGQGIGRQGDSYAIPTKDGGLKTLSLERIGKYWDEFVKYTQDHKEIDFEVTPIGCGLAGYSREEVWKLVGIDILFYRNIYWSKSWQEGGFEPTWVWNAK